MCTNVRSCLNKLDDINATISARQVRVFAATETWLHEQISDDLVRIPNFRHHRCDRRSRRGGGVCIWAHNSLNVQPLVSANKPDFLDAVWLSFPCHRIIFTCLYIPPDHAITQNSVIDTYIIANTDMFLSELVDFDLVLCGDLNQYKVHSICNQLNLVNLVHEPTRNTAVLDYILTSRNISTSFSVSVGPPISNSDHRCVSALTESKHRVQHSIQRPLYDLRESHIIKFMSTLSTINWTPFYASEANVDSKCEFLHNILSEIVKDCIPVKMVEMSDRDKAWMTPLLKYAIQMRWNAFRNRNFYLYKHWKQKVRELTIKAKKKWSSKAKKSARDLWSVAKEEAGTKTTNTVFNLIRSFDTVANAANAINEKFSSVFVPDTSNPICSAEDHGKSWIIDITVDSVEKMFSSINSKKAMGSDGIPSILYRKASKYLAGPFAHIFNLSILERRFPQNWKHSHIVPIPKSSPPEIENLLPISLLPVPAKIFERLILRSVRDTFIGNFGDNQFGCRSFSSTTCAIISLRQHSLAALESSKVSGIKIITYDFSKAFDKLSHSLIIDKLSSLSFPAAFVQWCQSYLLDRTQVTRIGSTCSPVSKVVSGVPQGSVLGPMFFCLVVGNLNPIHKETKVIQYVDDTTLCIPVYKDAVNNHVIDEHRHILEWASVHGFVVNTKKCKSLFFAKSRDATDTNLADAPSVQELKLLGVLINNRLDWSSHIQYICRQAVRRFYALRILRPLLDVEELAAVYFGAVRSILEYAAPAFGKLPENLSKNLDKVQKRCHRLICRVSHTSDCPCDRFPPLSARRNKMAIKLYLSASKYKNHALHGIIPKKSYRSTRQIQPPSSTTRMCHSFVPFTTMLLNGLDA